MWRNGHLHTHTAGECVNCCEISRRQSAYTVQTLYKKSKTKCSKGIKQIMLYPYNTIAYYVSINTMISSFKLKAFIIMGTHQKDTKASSK